MSDAISQHHKHFTLLCRACRRVLRTCGCNHARKPRRYSLEACSECLSGGAGDGVPPLVLDPSPARAQAMRNGKAHSTLVPH